MTSVVNEYGHTIFNERVKGPFVFFSIIEYRASRFFARVFLAPVMPYNKLCTIP